MAESSKAIHYFIGMKKLGIMDDKEEKKDEIFTLPENFAEQNILKIEIRNQMHYSFTYKIFS